MKNKRIFAVAALFLALVVLFLFAFVAVAAEHDCPGHGCRICFEIRVCLTILKNIAVAAAVILPIVGIIAFTKTAVKLSDAVVNGSPVFLHVKISD